MSEVDAIFTSGARSLPPPGNAPKRVKTGGRQKGTPNAVTRDVRKALRDLAESNAPKVQAWLDAVAAQDPAEALRLYLALIRYVVPVLSAAAIADITPKAPREALHAMSDAELLAIICRERAAEPLALPAPASALPNPDDEELLR